MKHFKTSHLKMFGVLVLSVCTSFLLLLYFDWRRKRFYKSVSKIPGPKPYPIIGNGDLFFWKSGAEKLKTWNDLIKKYESPCAIWLGPEPYIVIDKPEDLQIVLNSPNCLAKADVYNFFHCANGLFTATNTKMWKMHRKFLNPCFNQKILKGYIQTLNAKGRFLVERMGEELNRKPFDVFNYIGGFTLDSTVGKYDLE